MRTPFQACLLLSQRLEYLPRRLIQPCASLPTYDAGLRGVLLGRMRWQRLCRASSLRDLVHNIMVNVLANIRIRRMLMMMPGSRQSGVERNDQYSRRYPRVDKKRRDLQFAYVQW